MKINTNLTFYGGAWWATCPNNCGWGAILDTKQEAIEALEAHLLEAPWRVNGN